VLSISRLYAGAWRLLAISGGYPLDLFAEWNGSDLLPLGIISDGRFLTA
jgi:hypothetical protein